MSLKKLSLDNPDPLVLQRLLLQIEPLGVLTRDICYDSIPLDDEDGGKAIIPPRLFFLPRQMILVHAYGDDAFYDLFPAFERGGLSQECYVLDTPPRFLSNYFALQAMYERTGVVPANVDKLSLEQRRPPPMTVAQQREWLKQRRREIRDRDRKILGLKVVK